MSIYLKLPIKTVSEANSRQHWRVRNERKQAQQKEFMVGWRNLKVKVKLPCEVTFTRYASRLLDDDNLRSAFKGIRDALAKEIGIDDGSSLVKFDYKQEKLPKREYFISVEIREI